MVRAARYPVTFAVQFGWPVRLKDVVAQEKSRRAVLSAAEPWRTYGLPRGQAAQVRAQWRAEVRRLRAEGRLLDTMDALIEYGMREELRARGWDREWEPAPEEAWEGRWPGSRDGGFPDRVSVRLDEALVRQTVAACWHTSCEAIAALRAWRDENPGITPPRYRVEEDGRQRLVGPLAEYERLSAQVTTTGEVWRAGLDRGLARAGAMTAAQGNTAGRQGDTTP